MKGEQELNRRYAEYCQQRAALEFETEKIDEQIELVREQIDKLLSQRSELTQRIKGIKSKVAALNEALPFITQIEIDITKEITEKINNELEAAKLASINGSRNVPEGYENE